MTVYIENLYFPGIEPRAFRLTATGHWETCQRANYESDGSRARWYGFTATPPRDVLAQAYVDLVGYNPFEDCPGINPATISDTLQSCARAVARESAQ